MVAETSTNIRASWQLPPVDSRNGNITGFKLLYKKKTSAGSATTEPINDGNTLTKTVGGLLKYTEYEFQVLAFTSVGDGTNSSVKTVRTNEDGKQIKTSISISDFLIVQYRNAHLKCKKSHFSQGFWCQH